MKIDIVWTAVASVVLSFAAVVSGVVNGDLTTALGASAVAAAFLSTRER
jgi:hypothetical protein